MKKLSKTQKMMLTIMAGKYKRNTSKSCGKYQRPEDMDSYAASYMISGTCEKKIATRQTFGAVLNYSRNGSHDFRKITVDALLALGLIEEHRQGKYAVTYEITEAGNEQVEMMVNESGLWWDNV